MGETDRDRDRRMKGLETERGEDDLVYENKRDEHLRQQQHGTPAPNRHETKQQNKSPIPVARASDRSSKAAKVLFFGEAG